MGCAASEQLPAEMFATRQDRTQPGVGKRVGIAPTRLVFFQNRRTTAISFRFCLSRRGTSFQKPLGSVNRNKDDNAESDLRLLTASQAEMKVQPKEDIARGLVAGRTIS